ncbi:MAG TPA: xanthine dehydrogenase family protein subunit M [Stellaceae bacterium]|nr:xanthine dehydrogenase family protein subunit M [Stellaceae bacterium]
MKPAKFDYHAPASLDEALALLARYGDEARLLAGGQSLVPMMNFRLVAPAALIDLNRVADLDHIVTDGAMVRIGAMTRQRTIEFSPLIADRLPLLQQAIKWIGHLPTRSRGTIGGSIAHADPAAEIPMVLRALDGEVVARGAGGERRIAAADLFLSPLTTALAPDEILTEIRLPAMPEGAGCAIEEFARRHGDFAIASVAAMVVHTGGGRYTVRLATGGIGAVPGRLGAAETILEQQGFGAAALAAAAEKAAELVDPLSDHNASADFRRHLTAVLTRRAAIAAARAVA